MHSSCAILTNLPVQPRGKNWHAWQKAGGNIRALIIRIGFGGTSGHESDATKD